LPTTPSPLPATPPLPITPPLTPRTPSQGKPKRNKRVRQSPNEHNSNSRTKKSKLLSPLDKRVNTPTDVESWEEILTKKPYFLAPSMIEEMRVNKNIELVPVDALWPCKEYDRTKVGKRSKPPMVAVKALLGLLKTEGVNDVVLLVYSTTDHKVYATEGNTKLAAARHGKITHLPARVVAFKSATPRKVGCEAQKYLKYEGPFPGTHYPPSAIGFETLPVKLT
jgi:hypothetical protein